MEQTSATPGLAAVTGGAGHLGAALVRALPAAGWRVRALVHEDHRALEGLGVERLRGDLLQPADLERLCRGAQVVYHLAGRISIRGGEGGRVERINREGTREVVAACLACGVRRLVHMSSIHALVQEPLDEPLDESRPLASGPALTAYDRSKAGAEVEVLAGVDEGLDAVILNPSALVGPFDYKPSLMGETLCDLARRRLPALVDGGYTWVDTRDVAAAAVAAAHRGRSGERYLLAGPWAPLAQVAALVHEAWGTRPPRLVLPLGVAALGAPLTTAWARLTGARPRFTRESLEVLRTSNRRVDTGKAARELGFAPRPLGESVADTLAWFREQGDLP